MAQPWLPCQPLGANLGSMEGYRTDGFTEKIVLKVCETEDDLRATIAANFPFFTDPEGFGVAAHILCNISRPG